MRLPISVLLFLSFACTGAFAQIEDLTGEHEFQAANETSSFGLRLACQNNTDCIYANRMQVKGSSPYVSTQRLPVRAATPKNIEAAAWSLTYALRNYRAEHRTQDDAMFVEKLRDMFASNPAISNCWALGNDPVPMLACKFMGIPVGNPSLYLFVGSMSNCREPHDAFCGYAIIPLSLIRKVDADGRKEK